MAPDLWRVLKQAVASSHLFNWLRPDQRTKYWHPALRSPKSEGQASPLLSHVAGYHRDRGPTAEWRTCPSEEYERRVRKQSAPRLVRSGKRSVGPPRCHRHTPHPTPCL